MTSLSSNFRVTLNLDQGNFLSVASKQNAKTDPPDEPMKITGTIVPNLGLETRVASSAVHLPAENPKFNAR